MQKLVKYLFKFELHVHVDTILSEIKKQSQNAKIKLMGFHQ